MSVGGDDAASGTRIALRPRGGRRTAEELFEDREHGIDHHRARLRQAGRASPREGGSGGADRGSGRHGGHSLGRHVVDTGAAEEFGVAGDGAQGPRLYFWASPPLSQWIHYKRL